MGPLGARIPWEKDMSIAFLVLILIVLVGSGTMAAILGWMFYRIRQLEGGREDRSELGNIYQQLDAVRDQVFAFEDEMARLNERVDFTEKLLDAPRAESLEKDVPPDKDEPSGAP